jgi:hypothetical protein
VSIDRWKSCGWSPSAHPTPISSRSARPVNESHVWLKNVHSESVPLIQSMTGD